MKVLLDARAADLFPYGVGRYAREIAERLPSLRPEWNWHIIRHGKPLLERAGNAERITTLTICNRYPREQIELDRIVQKTSPDLYHALWFPVCESAPCHRLLTIQDVIPEQGYPEFQTTNYLKWRLWYRRTCHIADHIIVPSMSTMRDVACLYNYPADRLSLVPLGVTKPFAPASFSEIARIKQRFGLPSNYIFYSGHTKVSYKNTGLIATAIEILRDQKRPIPFVVSSGSPKYACSEQNIEVPLLNDNELASLISGATLMVYSSLSEGFGLPVLEAMACGTPVVCAASTSLMEVGGDAVLYFDPQSAGHLADSIHFLTQNALLRKQLSRRGLQRAQELTWEKTASMTLDIYDRLALEPAPDHLAIPVDWEAIAASEQLPPAGINPEMGTLREYAVLLTKEQKFDEAVSFFTKENKLHPNNPDTLREIAKCYKAMGNYANAIQFLEEMLVIAQDLDAKDHQRSALFHLGESHFRNHDRVKAIAYLEQCLTICPDHHAAKSLLKKIIPQTADLMA